MSREILLRIGRVFVAAVLLGCMDSNRTTRPSPEAIISSIPAADRMSRGAAIPGPLSAGRAVAGPMSWAWPGSDQIGLTIPRANAAAVAGSASGRLLWQRVSSEQHSIWLLDATTWGATYVPLPTVVDPGWEIRGTADFDHDGNADIVWENVTTVPSPGQRSIWFLDGNTDSHRYELLNSPLESAGWMITSVGDFNGDGKPDLVWVNTRQTSTSNVGDRTIWFLAGATGTTVDHYGSLPNVPIEWQNVGAGDFNGDGKTDLVWENLRTNERTVWFMNGGTYSGNYNYIAPTVVVPAGWSIAAVGDVNGDGKPDLVWQRAVTGERSIWFMNGTEVASWTKLETVADTQWDIAGVLAPVAANAGSWVQLGPSVPGVTEVALASDGQSLYRFYCVPLVSDPGINGKLERWNGTTWSSVADLTGQCHAPDVEVNGTLWVAGFATDNPDYGFASNANGNWVVFTGNMLVHQFGMHVAIAQGRPYEAFTARYSDGAPFTYSMLHVISPIPSGNSSTLNGGWSREVGYDTGPDLGLAGDANAWYAVTRSRYYLSVKKGYWNGSANVTQDLGPTLTQFESPVLPEIVVYNGSPVVTWLESQQKKIYVARFDGSQWPLLGVGAVASGLIGHIRADSYQNNFYVMQVNTAESPLVSINVWDGAQWAELPSALGTGESPSFTTGDIAVMSSGPVVGYVTGGVMKIKQLR
jgi:hypothetical protein